MCLRIIAVLAVLAFSSGVSAEPDDYDYGGTSTTEAPKPEVEMTHTVSSTQVRNTVTVSDSLQWKGLMQAYAGKALFEKFAQIPGIENLQFIPGDHTPESYYDKKIAASSRSSSLMVRISGATPFSMMFKVHEKLHRCAESASVQKDEDLDLWKLPGWEPSLDGVTATCSMESSVVVQGPIAIYGTVPGSFANRMLLLNQMKFEWRMKTDYSKKDTEIYSTFNIQ
ncbi:MAG: hypothetical protein AAF203_07480, partial [Pseudomonadota bacterium]